MKSFRIVLAITFMLMLGAGYLHAQFGKRLGEAVKRRAEDVVTRKAEDATGKAVEAVLDVDTYSADGDDEGAGTGGSRPESGNQKTGGNQQTGGNQGGGSGNQQTGGNQGSGSGNQQTGASQAPQTAAKTAEMAYAKSDFVPGDEIIFDDDLANEQMGEFPSQWDLLHGNAEVASYNGIKAIHLEVPTDAHIAPLMKDMKSYLPDVFTLEFDFWANDKDRNNDQQYIVNFYDEQKNELIEVTFASWGNPAARMRWVYRIPSSDDRRDGESDRVEQKENSWNHFALSFNKRALKIYVNGIRIANVPSVVAPKNLSIQQYSWGGFSGDKNAITNIRLAQGAVPLYDRMMSDGKFISYGITFDVGKSTIKPESMGEISRIVTLMNENPDLKFSVEGHTDSTGNAASNQTLSDARSKAVVDKLVEMGVSTGRLTSSGKGQTSPIADNGTDEGRAKNRRVEFVKVN